MDRFKINHCALSLFNGFTNIIEWVSWKNTERISSAVSVVVSSSLGAAGIPKIIKLNNRFHRLKEGLYSITFYGQFNKENKFVHFTSRILSQTTIHGHFVPNICVSFALSLNFLLWNWFLHISSSFCFTMGNVFQLFIK